MADDNEGEGPVSETQLAEEIAARKAEVEKFLAKKDKARALTASLQNPPISSKTAELKDANADIVEKVLASISDNELAGLVGDLDIESSEVLLKYVYRFMEKAQNSSSLLKLHALLVDKGGLGSIIRVMTDRKTV